jgi:hypothetical protein
MKRSVIVEGKIYPISVVVMPIKILMPAIFPDVYSGSKPECRVILSVGLQGRASITNRFTWYYQIISMLPGSQGAKA